MSKSVRAHTSPTIKLKYVFKDRLERRKYFEAKSEREAKLQEKIKTLGNIINKSY